TNAGLYDDSIARSKTCEYVPDVVPPGNPVNVGVVVATPAVPAPGTAVQQWMCDAVFGPRSPENVTKTWKRWDTGPSQLTSAKPVAGDPFGGNSFGPVSVASHAIDCA